MELVIERNKIQFEEWYINDWAEKQKDDSLFEWSFDGKKLGVNIEWLYDSPFDMQIGVYNKFLIEEREVVLSIYNNASGFEWGIAKAEGGTNLGDSWDIKPYAYSNTYEEAFKDAFELLMLKDLKEFQNECKPFHWSNYAVFLGRIKRANDLVNKEQ